MRVLILSDRYLPDATGTALRISRLVRPIVENCLCEEIHVATLAACLAPGINSKRSLDREEQLDGIYVHRYPSEASLAIGLLRLYRSFRFDLIHARGIRMGLYGRMLSALFGIPYIVELNSVNPQNNYIKAKIWTNALRSATRHIVLTNSAAEWLDKEYKLPPNTTDVVMNGVDLQQFQVAYPNETAVIGKDDGCVIGYAGTFAVWQGVLDFVHTASLVTAACSGARFLMVGDGPDFQKTQDLVADYGMSDKFVFTGRVKPEDVPGYIAAMDIFLIPRPDRFLKNHLATPLKLFEAMAMERAVVVSSVRGLSDIVEHDVTGLISPPEPRFLADAVLRLIDDKELRIRIGKAARTAVEERYTWEAAAEQLYRSYWEVEKCSQRG
ncbi:MAG TPA: glycosyltransferase family 4 protein [Anaerolineae bacterium]|nr:glycosyltransferase family 4 protein [Anaerolineae bacterium]